MMHIIDSTVFMVDVEAVVIRRAIKVNMEVTVDILLVLIY